MLYRYSDSLYVAVYAKRRPDNFIQLPAVVLLLDLMISLFLSLYRQPQRTCADDFSAMYIAILCFFLCVVNATVKPRWLCKSNAVEIALRHLNLHTAPRCIDCRQYLGRNIILETLKVHYYYYSYADFIDLIQALDADLQSSLILCWSLEMYPLIFTFCFV